MICYLFKYVVQHAVSGCQWQWVRLYITTPPPSKKVWCPCMCHKINSGDCNEGKTYASAIFLYSLKVKVINIWRLILNYKWWSSWYHLICYCIPISIGKFISQSHLCYPETVKHAWCTCVRSRVSSTFLVRLKFVFHSLGWMVKSLVHSDIRRETKLNIRLFDLMINIYSVLNYDTCIKNKNFRPSQKCITGAFIPIYLVNPLRKHFDWKYISIIHAYS